MLSSKNLSYHTHKLLPCVYLFPLDLESDALRFHNVVMRKRKTGGITFVEAMLCIALIVVFALCITKYANINKQKAKLKEEQRSLIAQSESLSDKLKQIRMREEMGRDDSYIESVARTQLDMVYPGEVIFRVSKDQYH